MSKGNSIVDRIEGNYSTDTIIQAGLRNFLSETERLGQILAVLTPGNPYIESDTEQALRRNLIRLMFDLADDLLQVPTSSEFPSINRWKGNITVFGDGINQFKLDRERRAYNPTPQVDPSRYEKLYLAFPDGLSSGIEGLSISAGTVGSKGPISDAFVDFLVSMKYRDERDKRLFVCKGEELEYLLASAGTLVNTGKLDNTQVPFQISPIAEAY